MNKNKSTFWYIISFLISVFIVLYLIPKLFGYYYGESYRYELIITIIIGLPLVVLVLWEKLAKNHFREASEQYDFEVSRKKDYENKLESQQAVFWFVPKDYIRSDMGKMVEKYFYLDEYNSAKDSLEKAKEKLSNIELFVTLLKVFTLIVAAFYFFYSIKDNQTGRIEQQIGSKIEKAEFDKLQDAYKLIESEISTLRGKIEVMKDQMDNKVEQSDLENLLDSINK